MVREKKRERKFREEKVNLTTEYLDYLIIDETYQNVSLKLFCDSLFLLTQLLLLNVFKYENHLSDKIRILHLLIF